MVVLLISLVTGLVFIPLLGNCPLFDWDEINFAECAREMLITGDYGRVQLNFQPFWEKPPFFIWLQALSMNIFGVNEFAARFPNAVCSIATVLVLYSAGSKFHSRNFGLLWSLMYIALMLPHLYFRSGIIDPWFNLFIFYAVYRLILITNNPNSASELKGAFIGGVSLGLAVLTKGPAALIVVGLTVLFVLTLLKLFHVLRSRTYLVFMITCLLVSLSWFIGEWLNGNSDVIQEFITYQSRLFNTGDAGHDGPIYYHVLVLLLGCFPASLIFIRSYTNKQDLTHFQLLFRRFMVALFWVVLILFSIVKTKIVHYSSLCYFPLTFMAVLGLMQYLPQLKLKGILRSAYWLITSLIALALILICALPLYKDALLRSNLITDSFAKGNLQAEVNWSGMEAIVVPIFLLASFLFYKGVQKAKLNKIVYALMTFLIFISITIAMIIPRVEMYTQHSAIAFYKACAKHDCYVETHGYKSYAYLFYSDRRPEHHIHPGQIAYIKKFIDERAGAGKIRSVFYANAYCNWMKYEKIDKAGYIVCKINDEGPMQDDSFYRKLYELNGYSFWGRIH